jgi:predicted nucleic acid-binding protein
MKGRFFLDTNVFLYSFDKNAPAKAAKAKQLIQDAITTRKGLISYQVVQEFLNVALTRFPVPMTVAEAEQYLTHVFRPLLSGPPSEALFAEAIHLRSRYQLGWYDSLIVASAIQSECSTLHTEDLHHGLQIRNITVQNPFR